ncbi:MAG: trypsin-like peptidase domain-containing protein [bacterium]
MIVRSDGVILTSKHLTNEEFTYTIEFQDGTKMPARLLKTHPTLDIALLSIMTDKPLSLPV